MNKEYSEQVGDSGAKFPKSNVWRCVWRGALGGMIGPLAFILLMAAKRSNDALAIAYLPLILPITAAVGAFIGLIIGLLHFVVGLKVGRFTALIVGIGLSTSLWIVLFYRYIRANEPQEFSWLNFIGWSILVGLIVGALPGLFSVPRGQLLQKAGANQERC